MDIFFALIKIFFKTDLKTFLGTTLKIILHFIHFLI